MQQPQNQNQEENKNIMLAIKLEELQKLVNYLATKPYAEVAEAMAMLLQLPRINVQGEDQPMGEPTEQVGKVFTPEIVS